VSQVSDYVGSGVKLLIERALPRLKEDQLEKALAEFRNSYDRHLLDTTALFPGMLEILEHVSAAGKRSAVLTNKPEGFALRILSSLNVSRFFSAVWGGDTGPLKKPDPEPVITLMRRFSVEPGRTVLIGDGVNDVLAAKAAGISSIALGYGYSPADELKALQPECFLASPVELRRFFLDRTGCASRT
jgi:phosphoglycolate phosphatase